MSISGNPMARLCPRNSVCTCESTPFQWFVGPSRSVEERGMVTAPSMVGAPTEHAFLARRADFTDDLRLLVPQMVELARPNLRKSPLRRELPIHPLPEGGSQGDTSEVHSRHCSFNPRYLCGPARGSRHCGLAALPIHQPRWQCGSVQLAW